MSNPLITQYSVCIHKLQGPKWSKIFALRRVEEAMRRHGPDPLIQTKGVRALGSGVQWPQDIQERARYSHRRFFQRLLFFFFSVGNFSLLRI